MKTNIEVENVLSSSCFISHVFEMRKPSRDSRISNVHVYRAIQSGFTLFCACGVSSSKYLCTMLFIILRFGSFSVKCARYRAQC